MSFWEIFFEICSNKWVLTGATYVGIFLTIYFSICKKHKKIRFAVAQNGEKLILVFWNASNETIFKEDISYFYSYGNVDCRCDVVYKSDPDIPLEIGFGGDESSYHHRTDTRFNRKVRKIIYSFDFLTTRKGYIIHFDNKQQDGLKKARFVTEGRIRGEKRNSICGYNNQKGKTAYCIRLIPHFLIIAVSFLLTCAAINQFCTGINIQNDIMWLNGILGIILFSMPFLIVGYIVYFNSMPLGLKMQYRKYICELGYQDITHEACIK